MDPTLHTRRAFLRTTFLGAAASLTLPVFLQKTFAAMDAEAIGSATQTATGRDGRVLILLQMAGGNDGLNTVIPYLDDAYYRSRPNIGLARGEVLDLDGTLGLHPRLAGLKTLYDEGALAIVRGVGYPNPNRSHFRATEIWQTAADADRMEAHGWLGRYFDHCCPGADPAAAIAIAQSLPQAFLARSPAGITFDTPENYRWKAAGQDPAADALFQHFNPETPGELTPPGELGAADFLRRTALDAQLSSRAILDISRRAPGAASYPKTRLGRELGLISRMIAGGLPTRVYYLSQSGYDTHSGQANTHGRLLGELSDALLAFARDLRAQGNFGRVTLMTFSEFGRRVQENGSNGTDHGAAGPVFMVGGGVRPGQYGRQPSLTELTNGDQRFNVDFRSLYATVLERWLEAPSLPVLGRQYPLLPVI